MNSLDLVVNREAELSKAAGLLHAAARVLSRVSAAPNDAAAADLLDVVAQLHMEASDHMAQARQYSAHLATLAVKP